MYYVYVLVNEAEKGYIGYTSNLNTRIAHSKQHCPK